MDNSASYNSSENHVRLSQASMASDAELVYRTKRGGCFLSRITLLLLVLFVAILIAATGLITHFVTRDNCSSSEESLSPEELRSQCQDLAAADGQCQYLFVCLFLYSCYC